MSRRFNQIFVRTLKKILLWIEPVFLMALAVMVITINPIIFGSVALFIYITAFSSIRNYLNGRFLLLNSAFSENQKLVILDKSGQIDKLGNLELSLRTSQGLDHIPYNKLIEQGYALLSGVNIGHRLKVHLHPTNAKAINIEELRGMLSTSPYLSPDHIPMLHQSDDSLQISIQLEDEKYLTDLLLLLETWGWVSNERASL
ncbi:MAG: hypothetical protein IPL46_05680 [Saprospiraceae bacterium]|nr:hypothetical protein [Saprospiraceae bacterium]